MAKDAHNLNELSSPTRAWSNSGRRGAQLLMVLLIIVGISVVLWNRYRPIANVPAQRSTRNEAEAPMQLAPRIPVAAQTAASAIHVPSQDQPKSALDRVVEKLDLQAANWPTETLTAAAQVQLAVLANLICHPKNINPASLENLVANDFICYDLGSVDLGQMRQVYDDGQILIRRFEALSSNATTSFYKGAHGLAKALRSLLKPIAASQDIRAKFKLFGIEQGEGGFITRQYLDVASYHVGRCLQQTAIWRCHWSYPKSESQSVPRLQQIKLEKFEEGLVNTQNGALFTDCTKSALDGVKSYYQQVLPGINHWLPRIDRLLDMHILGHHGLAVGDVNGDGLEDIYICDVGGLPNQLYLQRPDGTVTDHSQASDVDWLDYTSSALLIDLDNDGDQDLVIAMLRKVVFSENDGHGRFTLRGDPYMKINGSSLSAADYDEDGDLDIYLSVYMPTKENATLPLPIPYQDANNGGSNVLLRNDGDFQFVDVTDQVGLDDHNSRFSFAAAWDDYDNDGDVDLYVANDFGRNNLYRNANGHFTDVADEAGVEDIASGMSVAWGDVNRDGWMDLYVSNMFSAAGNRVAYQRQFTEGGGDQAVADIQRMARGNTLFVNNGNGTFRDASESASVTMGRWAWASKFVDLNNDGWQDLVVTNGYVTNEDTGDL